MNRAVPVAFSLVMLGVGCGATQQIGNGGKNNAPPDLAGSDAAGTCSGEFSCAFPEICSCTNQCMAEGACLADCDCPMGRKCKPVDGGNACVPGSDCGGEELVAEAVPPNLLLVLDRSCSMTTKVGMSTKWAIAVAAINKLTTTFKDKIRFGLTMFPDTDADKCAQGKIPIPLAPGNEARIQGVLTAALKAADPNFPDGPCVTNIDTAVQQASTDPGLADAMRASYVALISDGAQAGCNAAGGDAGTTRMVGDLLKRGVPTFVVGFGAGVDGAQLNAFAKAGGVPSGDPMNAFYKAEDQASLDMALRAIAAKTIGCTLQLKKMPPDAAEVYVFFDNTSEVPRDPNKKEGWEYDAMKNQIQFYGMACEQLRAGQVTDLDVVFGCREPTPG